MPDARWKVAEREFARLVEGATGVRCRRNLGQAAGEDPNDVETELPLAAQVRDRRTDWPGAMLLAALADARGAAQDDDLIVAALKYRAHGARNVQRVVAMSWSDFERLIGDWQHGVR